MYYSYYLEMQFTQLKKNVCIEVLDKINPSNWYKTRIHGLPSMPISQIQIKSKIKQRLMHIVRIQFSRGIPLIPL